MENEKLQKLIEVLGSGGWAIGSFRPLNFGDYELRITPQKTSNQTSQSSQSQ
jgi:hypothetical protein